MQKQLSSLTKLKPTEIKLENKFTDKFFPYLNNRSRFLVLYGGGGSGKSYFAAQKVVYEAFTKKVNILVIRKVGTTLRESVWNQIHEVIDDFGLSSFFKPNKTERTLTCTLTKSRIVLFGLDNAEKIKSITNITYIWIEEATEIEKKDFLQLNIRLRGKLRMDAYQQMILSFNPIDPSHWLRNHFFLKPTEETLSQTTISHSTFRENPKLDNLDEQIKNMENLKEIDEEMYEIYAGGNWTEITGLIFKNFRVIQLAEYPANFDEVIYGIDFGFNNPTAIMQINIYDGKVYLIEKLYKTGLTNADLIAEMKKLNIPQYAEIYADSAEPDRIEEIARAGFNVFKAAKAVILGIDTVKRIKLFSNPFNVNTNREFATYKWKTDRDGNILDEPVKLNDHIPDAVRYALYTHLKGGRLDENDAQTMVKEFNEEAIKKYAEDYMELKYQVIQVEGKTENEFQSLFMRKANLQLNEYDTVKRYVQEVYNY
jgi:phage terminase large subunit